MQFLAATESAADAGSLQAAVARVELLQMPMPLLALSGHLTPTLGWQFEPSTFPPGLSPRFSIGVPCVATLAITEQSASRCAVFFPHPRRLKAR